MARDRDDENSFEVDKRDLIQMDRRARRKARMATFGQDRFKPKVEKLKVRYNRKQKHKDFVNTTDNGDED
jgi:hypothetical protein